MNKRTGAALAALMILATLGGCQLAVPDAGAAGPDMLCGVFATLEPLDFGMEKTVELPPGWNGNPDDIFTDSAGQRIYAQRISGGSGDAGDYVFEGLTGSRLFVAEMAQGNATYHATVADGAITDVHVAYSDADMKLTGTLLFDVHEPCRVYANPVYQTPEGDVYVVQGQGLFFDAPQPEGSCGSTTISASTTVTRDGVQFTQTTEVELKIEAVNTNREIVLKQMDSEDRVVARTSVVPDNIPASVQVLADTAYIILEEHGLDYQGKAAVKRTLLAADSHFFNVRFTDDNGIVRTTAVALETPARQTDTA